MIGIVNRRGQLPGTIATMIFVVEGIAIAKEIDLETETGETGTEIMTADVNGIVRNDPDRRIENVIVTTIAIGTMIDGIVRY